MLHVGIKLVDQGGHGQACAIALGFVHDQAQIFAHPVHGKAEVELVVDHGFAAVVHLPALGGAFADDVEHLVHVEPGFLAKGDGFAQALHQAGNAHLVDHFGELAAARGAHEGESAREGHGHRAHAVEHRFVAAAHDGEQAVLGTTLAA